jgi:hypothetical protein
VEAQAQVAAALATGQVEAAARAADIKAEAAAALAAERTRAPADAAELRAANDRLLAQVVAAERLAEIEREHAKKAAQWRSAAQDDVPTRPDDRAQQAQWLATQMREMQLANVQMQAQMQAYMQDQIERLAEQQARRDEERREERLWEEERLKERLQLDGMYRSAIDGRTRQPSGPTGVSVGKRRAGPAADTRRRREDPVQRAPLGQPRRAARIRWAWRKPSGRRRSWGRRPRGGERDKRS